MQLLLVMMMITFHPSFRINQRFVAFRFMIMMIIKIMTMTTIIMTIIQNNNSLYLLHSNQMTTIVDAFQIPTAITIVRSVKQQRQLQHHHPNYQQPTSSVFIPRRSGSSITIRTIRSAVSYGRTDDSEWYTDVSTTTTTTSAKSTDSESSSISYSPITPTTPLSSSSSSSTLSYQTSITCSEQFDNIFHNNTNELIIIKFYASWCKSCKKVQSKINQLILEELIIPNNNNMNQNHTNNINQQQMIHFYNVEYNTNHELCIQNNITQLPTIHIYRSISKTVSNDVVNNTTCNSSNSMIGNYKKVQDFPCPPRDFYRLRDYIKFYLHQQKQHDGKDGENEEFGKVNLVPIDTPVITYVKNTNHDNTNRTSTTKYNIITTSNITNISTSGSNSSSSKLLDMGHDMIQTSILPTIIMENNSKIDNNESSSLSSITTGILPFETKQQQQLEPSSSLMESTSSSSTTTTSTMMTKHEQLFGWFFRHLRP